MLQFVAFAGGQLAAGPEVTAAAPERADREHQRERAVGGGLPVPSIHRQSRAGTLETRPAPLLAL